MHPNIRKIFISGHSSVLEKVGKFAEEAIFEKNVTPVCMPFPASPKPPANFSLDTLSGCDAVVLIVGNTCGTVWQNTGFSITELEYEKARELELDIFAFMIDDSSFLPNADDDDRKRLDNFIKRIQKEITYSKTTSENLKQEIQKAIENASRYNAFLPPEAYFRYRLINSGSAFDMLTDDFINRKKELDLLNNFCNSSKFICFVKGPTGCGKSHLLFEFAKQKKSDGDWTGFWNGLEFNVNALSDIRADTWNKGIAIIDCNPETELKQVAALLRNILTTKATKDKLKIIVSLRDYTDAEARSVLGNLYVDEPHRDLIDLSGLPDEEETRQWIVNKTLPVNISNIHAAEMLRVSGGLPLPLKICIKLIKSKKIDLTNLPTQADLQNLYLKSLLEAVIAKSRLDSEKFEKFLRLAAVLSPFVRDDAILRGRASGFLGITDADWIDYIGKAREIGVIQKKGRFYRVYPDILGDYLVDRACYAADGTPKTCWTESILGKLLSNGADVYETHFEIIIKNLAETWFRHKNIRQKDFLWDSINGIFEAQGNFGKQYLLKRIKNLAYYNPEWALKFANKVFNNRENYKPEEYLPGSFMDGNDIIKELPPFIYHAAFHPQYFNDATDLLWDLALKDARETNAYPGHPLRLLAELAEYKPAKSFLYTKLILERARKWFDDGKVNPKLKLSPLKVAKAAYSKQFDTFDWYPGHVSFGTRFIFPYKEILELRGSFRELLKNALSGKYGIQCVRESIEILVEDLNPPHGVGGASFTPELQQKWMEEQTKSWDILSAFVKETSDFIPKYWILDKLKWAAQHHRDESIRKRAKGICDKIQAGEDYDFFHVLLAKGWDEIGDLRKKQAEKILATCKTPETLIAKLREINELLIKFMIDDSGMGIGALAHAMAQVNPELGLQSGEILGQAPLTDPLLWLVNPLIEPARRENALFQQYLKLMHWIFDHNILPVIQYLPQWYRGHAEDLRPEEWFIIENMVSDAGAKRNIYAFYTLRQLAKHEVYYEKVKQLVLALPDVASDETTIANAMCEVFAEDKNEEGLKKSGFNEDEVRKFTFKFIKLKNLDLDIYWLDTWLGHVGNVYPGILLEFFIKRLEHRKSLSKDTRDFRPIPFHREIKPYFQQIDASVRKKILQELFNLLAEPFDSDSRDVRAIFWHAGRGDDKTVIELFTDILTASSDNISKVINLLHEAPPDFAIKPANLEFIKMLLAKAESVSDEVLKKTTSALISSAITGEWSRTIGEPPQKFVEIITYCDAVLANTIPHEPTYAFFEFLKAAANTEIFRASEWDEEVDSDA